MKTSTAELSPLTYLKKSIYLLENNQLKEALLSMDTAILLSHHAPFYIYQKIKLLYKLGAFKTCEQVILTQLPFLYEHASLYLLARTLDFFQKINHLPVKTLEAFLEEQSLPICLASEYERLMFNPNADLLPALKSAFKKDAFKVCISYAQIIEKTTAFCPDVLYIKAYAYHRLGFLRKAQLTWEAYLQLVPENFKAYDYLGMVFMELGLYNKGIDVFKIAHRLAPENKEYLAHLGECYYMNKNYPLAAKTYESIKEAQDLQIYFNLSHIYKKCHQKSLSRKYRKYIRKQLKQ